MARYADGLKSLQQTGAVVLAFTAPDFGVKPMFRGLRGRAAIYNELLRRIADDIGIGLIDFWRFDEFRDARLWDRDRVHLSALGHEVMADRVFDCLPSGEPLTLPCRMSSAKFLASPATRATVAENIRWAVSFAAPWAIRRLRRITPGTGVLPKYTALAEVN